MPRNAETVRRSLQMAALELYRDKGYDMTTAAEIAARAGVTERTFFRHFSDKREVLFSGETLLSEALVAAIRATPSGLGPWETLFRAFRAAEPLFIENRAFSEPRQHVIAASPALQERAHTKTRSLIGTLATALAERGVSIPLANLTAQMGMATMGHAVAAWFADSDADLDDHIVHAFADVRALTSSA